MAISTQQESDVVSEINVTPLVDVVLVLLVVFMVTAKLVVGQTLPLDLPKAGSGEEQNVVLHVAMATDGRVLLNGEPATFADLAPRAEEALRRDPALRAVIDADGRVPHQDVVRVMDALGSVGIAKIAFGIETPTKAAP